LRFAPFADDEMLHSFRAETRKPRPLFLSVYVTLTILIQRFGVPLNLVYPGFFNRVPASYLRRRRAAPMRTDAADNFERRFFDPRKPPLANYDLAEDPATGRQHYDNGRDSCRSSLSPRKTAGRAVSVARIKALRAAETLRSGRVPTPC
jgi:hypothetical protein